MSNPTQQDPDSGNPVPENEPRKVIVPMRPFIWTIPERCRMCYTCVRECPAKAIRITDGQAEVLAERCIACGNCVRVCSQNAKQIRSSVKAVEEFLHRGDTHVAVCLAPSFPAQFESIDYTVLIGMLRKLGFDSVHEVSFGADLVAAEYRRSLSEKGKPRLIATTCPAIASFVQRYYPETVANLAPIVSPMIAIARAVRHEVRGKADKVAVVFVGPCVAKKMEAAEATLAGDVDAVLTYSELASMFEESGIEADNVEPSEFDPPHGADGALFPIGRGMLQAAQIREDLMTGEVVATEGRRHMLEAIREFSRGDLGARLLEVLCCEGCIMGAGVESELPLFSRRRLVRKHTCRRVNQLDRKRWAEEMDRLGAAIDLSRSFEVDDQRLTAPANNEISEILARMGKFNVNDELDCGACGYDTCREHAIAIHKGMAENEMCLPYTIEQLKDAISEVEASHRELADAQKALYQSEKMATMGHLAAGVAHEVNNPLGVVLMYAHLLLDECEKDSPLHEDLMMIVKQADRCKRIVSGLLDFARENKLSPHDTDVCEMVDDLCRAIKVPERIKLEVEHAVQPSIAYIDQDQMIQVLTNLVNNAIAVMPESGTIGIRTGGDDQQATISVTDTGTGISEENLKKIFDPFFTTKPMGEGTGLGLAVTYGIVEMHGGDIEVETNADPDAGPTGATFKVIVPRKGKG